MATARNGVATFAGLSLNQVGHHQIVADTDPLTTLLITAPSSSRPRVRASRDEPSRRRAWASPEIIAGP
jgi:hypothetical protein